MVSQNYSTIAVARGLTRVNPALADRTAVQKRKRPRTPVRVMGRFDEHVSQKSAQSARLNPSLAGLSS